MGKTINSLLEKHKLSHRANALTAHARRCIRVVPYPTAQEELDPHTSRFGGVPHVPKGFVWPTWKSQDGDVEPLAHIATLNLAEVHAAAGEGSADFERFAKPDDVLSLLPRHGMLSIWYASYAEAPWGFDPKDAGSLQITFVEDPADATETAELPHELMTDTMWDMVSHLDDGVFVPCTLDFVPQVSLPTADWLASCEDPIDLDDNSDAYEALLQEVFGDGPMHTIGGHARNVQGPMELECALASAGVYVGDATGYASPEAKKLEHTAKNWLPLLQIDTDEEGPRWMWGDCGMLYFWMKQQALRERDWKSAWGVLQCF
jgi:uncharacterized protein YwqG